MSWSDPVWALLIGLTLTGWVRTMRGNHRQNAPEVAWAAFQLAVVVFASFKLFVR